MNEWRKSSHSGGMNDDACVELAMLDALVGIRDSKCPEGGHLELGPESFVRLLEHVRQGGPVRNQR